MKLQDCKSKAAKIEFIKHQVQNDDAWMIRGLMAIYQYQTKHEQTSENTTEHNGVGFTGVDGTILTSFANQAIGRGVIQAVANKQVQAVHFFSHK